MINISELINDPDFTQPNGVNITRTVLSVENYRPSKVTSQINLVGIITINNENQDSLEETADINTEKINVFTYTRLKCTGVDKLDGINYEADVVTFNGNKYKVVETFDDTQYGFCKAVAEKIRMDVM